MCIGGTYGVMPELFLMLNDLIAKKELETAKKLQYAINDIISTLVSGHGNMYAMIKEVLRLNEDLDIGSVRSPLTALTDDDKTIAKKAVELINQAKKIK